MIFRLRSESCDPVSSFVQPQRYKLLFTPPNFSAKKVFLTVVVPAVPAPVPALVLAPVPAVVPAAVPAVVPAVVPADLFFYYKSCKTNYTSTL